MNLANEIWKLIRDVILVLVGTVIVGGIVFGKVSPSVSPMLIPLAYACFALPSWLRSDERKQRNRRSRNSSSNGAGSRHENGR